MRRNEWPADWHAIYQLLHTGAYEQASALLFDIQAASAARDDRFAMVAIDTMREICLACLQCQAEVEWHRQAQQAAEQREQQLKNRAQALLGLVSEHTLADTAEYAPIPEPDLGEVPESAHQSKLSLNLRNLMQRMKQVFVLEPPPPATLLTQEFGGPALSGNQTGETLHSRVEEEEAQAEPTSAVVAGEPETRVVSASLSELAPSAPLSTNGEAAELGLGLPPVIAEPETPFVSASLSELAPSAPLSTNGEAAELEPAQLEAALPPVIAEPETPFVSASPGELVSTAPLITDGEEAELEAALPPAIEEPEARAVSMLPAAAQHAPELYTMAIYCLGPFRVYQRHKLIEEWNGLRGQAVFKYLIARRATAIAKDVLMDVFWPDADAEAARRNLHQAIYSLRQTLRRRAPDIQHIQFENNQYLIDPALSIWIDVEEFQTHVQSGRQLEAAGQLAAAMVEYGTAEGLYQGDFLEEDPYEDWSRPQRDRLRTTYLDIADRLSEYYRQRGEYSAAIALCQKILTLDNCVEEAHRRLMRCYLAQGQRHLAIRQYHTCVWTLDKELDVPPADETRQLYASISTNS